ncbi:5'-nucleotidase [Bifidobacterium samirii]|uniref:5'-nucleotidase n=1 Tax=Bifidobacterium samirii TaxID=2306974 RepID=A0A430FVM0_9BIFI|nr:5'-nucleotidase [Bifidobacterium samirii]RSX58056.1 5'-nucleotidase [Bifidobacterium samirii]
MGSTLARKALVIGVASSALFDLEHSDRIFREEGVAAYEAYQEQHIDDPFRPGVAFPFISRLLRFNELFDDPDEGVEVIVMSRNSPKTGLRVMNSIEHYGLGITRSVFRSGLSTFSFMPVFDMSLFLTADAQDVDAAVAAGLPAGCVLPSDGMRSGVPSSDVRGSADRPSDGPMTPHDDAAVATDGADAATDADDGELRVAFDFDGVLAGDSAERVFQQARVEDPSTAVARYSEHERAYADQPIEEGPLKRLLAGINRLQDASRACKAPGHPTLRVSLVTARNAPAHKRPIQTLERWGLTVDDAFFLGGLDKTPVLNELRPHIFFDDQLANLDRPDLRIPAVHIPFGVRNR